MLLLLGNSNVNINENIVTVVYNDSYSFDFSASTYVLLGRKFSNTVETFIFNSAVNLEEILVTRVLSTIFRHNINVITSLSYFKTFIWLLNTYIQQYRTFNTNVNTAVSSNNFSFDFITNTELGVENYNFSIHENIFTKINELSSYNTYVLTKINEFDSFNFELLTSINTGVTKRENILTSIFSENFEKSEVVKTKISNSYKFSFIIYTYVPDRDVNFIQVREI